MRRILCSSRQIGESIGERLEHSIEHRAAATHA
jgi:hypothetical protein